MSYTPTVWECGDTITAEKLNKLEQAVAQGGGSEPLIVEAVEYTPTCEPGCTPVSGEALSATWQDMKDAIDEGRNVFLVKLVTDGGITATSMLPLTNLAWADGEAYFVSFGPGNTFNPATPTETIVVTSGRCECGAN